MRALLMVTLLFLSSIAFAQEPTSTPTDATAPAPTETPAVESEASEPTGPTIVPLRGILANINASYFSRELMETGTAAIDADINSLILDLKGGYVLDFGLFVGAQVEYTSGKSGTTDLKTFVAGPSVGYSDSYTGIFASATYHLFGNSDMGAAGEYKEVKGWQLDLAYPMQITESMRFGPQLSFQNLKYSDSDTLGEDKRKELTPYFGFWMLF